MAWAGTAFAQESSYLAGAGGGSFPPGATFNGVPLTGMRFGFGIDISPPPGPASGDFETTLLGLNGQGQPQIITIEGKVASGSIGSTGDVLFTGASTVDMGTAALRGTASRSRCRSRQTHRGMPK